MLEDSDEEFWHHTSNTTLDFKIIFKKTKLRNLFYKHKSKKTNNSKYIILPSNRFI